MYELKMMKDPISQKMNRPNDIRSEEKILINFMAKIAIIE